jgi:hypothetical protein
MTLEAKSEPWGARDPRAPPLHLTMTFESDVLVLGAGTRIGLAKRGMSLRKIRDEAFDEARVAALLAVDRRSGFSASSGYLA